MFNPLPNTPSAEVIENQGLELGATAKNHQEKIEEVFLHLIELEKRVKALETENAQLKSITKKSKKRNQDEKD